jgi:hypothetical protein
LQAASAAAIVGRRQLHPVELRYRIRKTDNASQRR